MFLENGHWLILFTGEVSTPHLSVRQLSVGMVVLISLKKREKYGEGGGVLKLKGILFY